MRTTRPPIRKAVARGQAGGKGFLDLAQGAAAAAAQPHLQHLGLDDGADIHPQKPVARGSRSRHRPVAQHQPLPAVIGAQRIAAGRGEIQTGVEIGAGQRAIGTGRHHLGIKRIGVKGRGAGGQQDMLAQHVQRPRPARIAVQIAFANRVQRRHAFDLFKAVRGHDPRARGRVIAVIGPADALDQPLDVSGRADLDHQIDRAPIDAQIKAAGGDHGAQIARRHRRLDPGAGLARQAAVMQPDGQVVVIRRPQRLKEQLGLRAGVDENDRGLRACRTASSTSGIA
jgi:hypothetical protein